MRLPVPGGAPVRRAPRTWAAIVCALALTPLLATGVSLADHGAPAGAPGPEQFDDPAIRLGLAQARVEDEQRRRERATPQARSERERSRRAYRGMSRGDALAVARDKHGGVVTARPWRPLVLRPGEEVERYLGDYSALVAVGERRLLAESTLPLRALDEDGRLAPVELELEDRGTSVVPRNPLIDVRISKDPRAGATFVRAGFAFGLVGAASAEDPMIVDGKAFTANVFTDTDLITQPMPSGVETFLIVRSVDSPESAALAFDLPSGAELRAGAAGDRGVQIVRGDRLIGRVEPPAAWDADGEPVPLAYEIQGDRLELRFPHRERDVAYPLVVDPIVGDTVKENFNLDGNGNRTPCNGSDPFAGQWGFIESHANYFPHYTSGDCTVRGLTVYAYSGVTYPDNSYGEWLWQAPRQSYIERADFGYVTTTNRQGTCTIEGIWAPSRGNWDYGTWRDIYGNTGSSPTLRSGEACRDLSGNYKEHCVGASCIPGNPPTDPTGTRANMMVFGMLKFGTETLTTYPVHRMEGATMWLYDYDVPQLTGLSHSGLPSGWTNSASVATSVSAREPDPGLGVKYFNLYRNGAFYAQRAHGCVGDRYGRCPDSWSNSFSYSTSSEPEGINSYDIVPFDAIVKPGPRSSGWALKIDRGGPAITPSGALWDARNQASDHRNEGLYEAQYGLRIEATDGSTASDATARSGVKSIDVQVLTAGGSVASSHPDPASQGCNAPPRDSCGKTRDWTFNSDEYADGDYKIVVTVTDQAGNRSETRWDVTVDRRGDIYVARQYTGDPADGGQALAQEWARIATHTSRMQEFDLVTTRTDLPCDPGNPSSPVCTEHRARTRYSEEDPPSGDAYVVYRGAVDDPRVPEASDLLKAANDSGAEPIARGPLNDVTAPWQMRPPASGSEYELYEATQTEDTAEAPDGENGEDPATEQTTFVIRTWADARTGMPIKEEVRTSEGDLVGNRFWTYDRGRLETSQVPSDHFRTERPATVEQEKQVDFRGDQPIGQQPGSEAQTSSSATESAFTPYYLGPNPGLQAGSFCLTSANVVSLQEDLPTLITEPEADGAPEPTGPVNYVGAYYERLGDGVPCSPGSGTLDTPILDIRSTAKTSVLAEAWRNAYVGGANAIQLDPQHEDFLRAGVQPVLIGIQPTTAYVITLEDDATGAYLEQGDTSVVVTGPFDKTELPAVLSLLQPR